MTKMKIVQHFSSMADLVIIFGPADFSITEADKGFVCLFPGNKS